jgi:protein-disulfide isomerase
MIKRRRFMSSVVALMVAAFSSTAQAEMNEIGKKLLAAVPAHGEKAIGDPKAPVVMIEYASATCPHCAEFHNDIWPDIKKNYVETGKVYFIFRELPTDQLALAAFMLMRCVPDDKYFSAIEEMYRTQQVWMKRTPKDELFKIVSNAGLDKDGANACMKNETLAKSIVETRNRASQEFNVKGTPSFFINGFFTDAHDDPKQVRVLLDRMLEAVE